MATIKIKKTTSSSVPSTQLSHGELGVNANSLFFGDSSNKTVEVMSKKGGVFSGNVSIPTLYNNIEAKNVFNFKTTSTPNQVVIYTKIKYLSSTHMPYVHLKGYAYGLQSPIDLKIGFYIYNSDFSSYSAVNNGAWRPEIRLFKYTETVDGVSTDYVAIGFIGNVYYLGFNIDVGLYNMGTIGSSVLITGWSSAFRSQADVTSIGSLVPEVGVDNAVKVNYKPIMITDDISDATTIGKNLMKAASAAAARSTIGAGTSNFSGSYTDLSNKPTIPAIPDVMTVSESTTGTATTGRLMTAAILKSTILHHSPAGARPASSVSLASIKTDNIKNTYDQEWFLDNVGSVYFGMDSANLYLKGSLRPSFYNNENNTTYTLAYTSELSNPANITQTSSYRFVNDSEKSTWNGKQAALVSGTNIKTINSTSLLGNGNIAVQATLVSGTNIKTINGNSLLGAGDITISGGSGGGPTLLRARTTSTALTAVTTSGISVSGFTAGDTLMIEVNKYAQASYNPKIITITVGKSGNTASTDADYICSWSTWNGTEERHHSFIVGYSGTTLYFTDTKFVSRTVSGSTMTYTTGTYSLYVGRIWKVAA